MDFYHQRKQLGVVYPQGSILGPLFFLLHNFLSMICPNVYQKQNHGYLLMTQT